MELAEARERDTSDKVFEHGKIMTRNMERISEELSEN